MARIFASDRTTPTKGTSYARQLILPRPPWPIVNETATDAPTRQLTVAAENRPIRILYGEDNLGAEILSARVDEANDRLIVSCGWCLGEIAGIDQIYFDGAPAPAGVTFTHYLGTPSQGVDPTLQGAIGGYSDTNVITVGGVNVGTAYTVAIIPKGVKAPRQINADLRGLKLFDPRQNRIRRSEDYANSAWGKTRVTPSSPGGTAPTGAAITKLAETTGSGTHVISISESAAASTAYRASLWIQAAGRDKGRFTLAGESIDFDLTAVTAGSGHIIAEGSGWYRIDLKATTGGAASAIGYQLNILNEAGSDSYTGDGSSGFNLGGSLIVQSSESYPYIQTTTAHVTPTTAYSTNPALALGNFYASSIYGKGQTPNYGSVARCAIANDESVGGSPRRSINLTIERIVSVEQWIETLRTYCACFIDGAGDKPTLIPDRPAPTRRTLTESDIAEGTFILTRRSGRDVPTVVTVIYTDTTVSPYRDAEATAKISGVDTGTVQRREITLRLPGIDSHAQAYREAVEQLNTLRLIAEDIEFETYDDAIVDQIGDIIALNITNPIPISGDLYRIMAAEPVHGSGSAWRILAAAHTDLIYSDEVQAGSHVNDTVLPDASSIDGPTSLNATSSTEINIDGTPLTSLNVTWTAATSIYVDRYQIEWKRSSDSDWQRAETQNTNFSIKPVIPAISYDIRVRTASQLVGIYSAWVSLTLSATGKGDIPAAPTALATVDTFHGIVLTWTNPAINDLSHIEIWRSADNNRANATHINDAIGTSYTDANVGGTAYYWIRAVNTSEITSDWHPTSSTGGVEGTKTTLDSAAADTTAPTDPGSLALTTGIEEAALAVIAWVKGTWTASTDDGILSGYQVQWWTSEHSTKISTFAPTGTTEYRIVPVKPGLAVSMRVRAEDWAGNVSNWTTTQTIVAASYGTPPANVSGATLTAGLDKLVARWTNPADESWLETEVYLGTSSGFTPGSGNLKGTVRADELVIADGLTNGTNYYAKFRTRSKGGESGYSAAVGPAAPFKVTDLNIANYFETAAILNAYIATLDAAKITTGTLSADRIGANTITAGKLSVSQLSAIAADLGTVTSGILQGAIVRTAASGARVQLNSTNGVEAFNSSGTRTVHLSVDGSGYVGNAGAVSWDTAGTVTIPGSLIAGSIVGNTIKTALSGWRVTLNESGLPLRYWDGTNTHFSVDTSGNIEARGITIKGSSGNVILASGDLVTSDLYKANSNLLLNPTAALGNANWSGTSVSANLGGGGEGFYWSMPTTGTAQTLIRESDLFRFSSDVYSLSAEMFTGGLSSGAFVCDVEFFDTNQSYIDGGQRIHRTTAHGWTRFSASGTSPSGTVWARVRFFLENAVSSNCAIRRIKFEGSSVPTPYLDSVSHRTIDSSNISTYIADLAVGNAQIGNVIQGSATAGDGNPVWKLDKLGAAVFRSIEIRDNNGALLLASGGNLDYSRVGGTKPPSNADRTADNVAAGAPWSGVSGSDRPDNRAGQTDANLIIDAHFGKTLAEGWGRWWNAGGGFIVVGLAANNNAPVLRFITSGATQEAQTINLTPASPGERFHVAMRVWIDGSYNGSVGLNLHTARNDGVIDAAFGVEIQSLTAVRDNWVIVDTTVTLGNQEIAYVRPYILGSGTTGTFNIDWVYVSRVPRQVTPSNISTYIASLAVDTLQIAGNAVTIPVSAYTSGTTTSSSINNDVWFTIQTTPNINTAGAPLKIDFGCGARTTDAGTPSDIRIRVRVVRSDGTVLGTFLNAIRTVNNTFGYFSFSLTHSPGTSTFYYYMQISHGWTSSSLTLQAENRSINLLAVKK